MAVAQTNVDKFLKPQMQKQLSLEELFSTAIDSILGNHITLIFVLVILTIFISVLFFPKTFFGRYFSSGATTVLPSIGILGTFFGVFIALLNFDQTNMQGSMNLIIDGLKIAFITSIFGLFTGIVIKLVQSSQNDSDSPDGVGAEEILTELQQSRKDAEKQNKNLLNAISGDADSSLNTQIKLMRTDLNDFAKTVAEANTTAFIDALKEAIADFNKNLTEQFGENFKRLNDAVGKLLEWQENNKQDMEHMRSSIDTAVKGIGDAETSLTQIKESADTIPETVKGLSTVLEAIQAQINDLENHLQTFADVSTQAKDAIPKIEEVLTNYTDGLEKTSNEILTNLTENLDAQKGVYEELQTNFKTVFDDFGTLGTELQNNIKEVANTLSSKTNEILDNLAAVSTAQNDKSNEIINNFTSLSEEIMTSFKDTTAGIINNLSEASEEVISNATMVTTEHTIATKEIAEELAKQVDVIGNTLASELKSSIETVTTSFQTALSETQESQKIQISSFNEELSDQYKKSTSNLHSMTEELLNESKESLNKALNTELQGFSDRLGSIAKRMSDQFGQLSDAFQKAIVAAEKLDKK